MSQNSNYERIPKLANFVSLMAALLLVDPMSSYLTVTGVEAPLTMTLTLLVAGVAAYIVEWVIETTISSWPDLRRVLVGTHFIEGTWIDVILNVDKVIYVGIVHIEYDGHRFSFSGEDAIVRWITEDRCFFVSDGSFNSEMMVFNWPNLRYKFSGRNSKAAGWECQPKIDHL